jgi:hypothetical protein
MGKKLSRRDFLKLAGATSAGLVISACGVTLESPAPTPTLTATSTLTPAPTATASSIPTPEPERLPENLGGDPLYAQTIEKMGTDRYMVKDNQILVDWEGNGNFEEAFVKNGENWEVRKFVLKREKVDISSMTCHKIYDRTSTTDTSCIQEDSKLPTSFYIKFRPGDLVWEARRDENGNILPGSIIYTYAHTRREPETPEEVIKIALQVDYGDGMNQASFKAQKPAVSITEIAENYPINSEWTLSFAKKWNFNSSRKYYEDLNAYVEKYNNYYLGIYFSSDLIFFPDGSSNRPMY